MDDRMKESVSALMDDEVNELELQRVLSHADQHELASVWKRYHRVRDLLNRDKVDLPDIDVRTAVSSYIEQDEAFIPESKGKANVSKVRNSIASPVRLSGLLTIAASAIFAFGFVFQNSVQFKSFENPAFVSNLNIKQDQTRLSSVLTEKQSQRQPKIVGGLSPENADRLNSYLLRHSEHSVLGSLTNVMPLARVASVNSIGI